MMKVDFTAMTWKSTQRTKRMVFTLALCLVTGSLVCHAADKKKSADFVIDTANLVWPQPPQRKRVSYVMQITGVDDVKGRQKRSWMDRAAGAREKNARAHLKSPYGVAADSKNRIYVADPANRVVFVFDTEHRQVEYRGNRAPAQLALPMGVAIDDQDRLFVSDSFFHQITCFSPDGEVLGVFGADELERPGGIAVDVPRKLLYVADSKANRVTVFSTENFAVVKHVGGRSTPGEAEDGKFSSPTNVAVDSNGTTYVTDTWNFRVQVFDRDGHFLRAFGQHGVTPGSFVRPKGVAVDAEGHVYVADAEFNNFQILTPKGEAMLAVGSFGSDPGQFALVAGIAVDKNNRIYVTDQFRGRVQVFQYHPEGTTSAANVAPSH